MWNEKKLRRARAEGRYEWVCLKCGTVYWILPGSWLDTPLKGWHRCYGGECDE